MIEYVSTNSLYKFGSGSKVEAMIGVIMPITLGSKQVFLRTDIVSEDIPLLLSKRSMKIAETVLNTMNDTVEMLGEQIPLIVTSTDHYAIPINQNRAMLETNTHIVLYSLIS